LQRRKSINWDEYLAAFALGIGTKHPSLCDYAFIAHEIFELRMPEDFKYYGQGGIRSDMLCRDLALLRFSSQGISEEEVSSKYEDVLKVGELLSEYDHKTSKSVALFLWNGNRGANDLTSKEIEKSRKVIEQLKKAKRTSLSE